MSQEKLTPLGINALGALLEGKGININADAARLYGVSNTIAEHTKGLIENETCLGLITDFTRKAYENLHRGVKPEIYDKLISIGKNSIPALGNSNPKTFPNYKPLLIESFGCSGGQQLYKMHYSPQNQKINTTQIITVTVNDNPVSSDNYKINQDLFEFVGKLLPGDRIRVYTLEGTSYGFLHTISSLAMREFKYGKKTMEDFCSSFNLCQSFLAQSNSKISSLTNASGFLEGTYSNMNDLITSDITGITLSTLYWGQDLIKSGRAIDLSKLKTFGSPYDLLLTMKKNNSIINSVAQVFLTSGFNTSSLNELLEENRQPTKLELKNLYSAFEQIKDDTLKDVLITLNVQTENIETLADLLNPKKLFPNSYSSLTVPKFNTSPGPTNSKTYYLIYANGGVNSQLEQFDFGDELQGIVPKYVYKTCGALRTSMLQVKHIENMEIEKFSQVVTNLELTTGLDLINGTSTPNEPKDVDKLLQQVALGSGEKGLYVTTDFFGAMSGLNYKLAEAKELIKEIETAKLKEIYNNIAEEMKSQATLVIEQKDSVGGGTGVWHLASVYNDVRLTNPTLAEKYSDMTQASAVIDQSTRLLDNPKSMVTNYLYSTLRPIFSTITPTPEGEFISQENLAKYEIKNEIERIYYKDNASTAESEIQASLNKIRENVKSIQENYGNAAPYANISFISDLDRLVELRTTELKQKLEEEKQKYTDARSAAIAIDPIASTKTGDISSFNFNTVKVDLVAQTNQKVDQYINEANNEIQNILKNNPEKANKLNDIWDSIGTQLSKEMAARDSALNQYVPSTVTDIYSFIDSVKIWATQTEPNMSAQVLEAISDLNNIGGQSIIGMMREERNSQRLGLAGGTTDNKIPDTPPTAPTVEPTIPVGNGETLPKVTGETQTPGSFGGSPEVDLVPANLDIFNISTTTKPSIIEPIKAVEQVIHCNCDCWDDLPN